MIGIVVFVLFGASYLLSSLLGLPTLVGLSYGARFVGIAFALAGLGVIAWTLANRNPVEVVVSTYVTFTKAIRRTPANEMAGRTEPLIVSGPQKYIRNPLYFGVVIVTFGFAILTTYSFVFVATVVVLSWFDLVIIPFEEKELHALFGEQWREYSENTPMLVPFTKRKKHSRHS